MIRCEDVCARLSGQDVLRGVSLTCPEGGVTALLGKNGSGKTTLLRAIGRMIRFEGRIRIGGRELGSLRSAERARLVAVMPQLLPRPHVRVRDLVAFGRSPYTGLSGVLGERDRRIVSDTLERTGTGVIADKYADAISGGELRRAFFAMLLAQDTPVMLLDEPTANLDAEYARRLLKMIAACRSSGKTVLLVLHDVNQALAAADRIAVLENGRCAFAGTPAETVAGRVPERLLSLRAICGTDADGNALTFYN